MGFDNLSGESVELTEDESSVELVLSSEQADAGVAGEPSADALEKAEFELEELLQLPTDLEAEELPAALEADEPVAVLEPDDDLELEVSAIEDDLDELEDYSRDPRNIARKAWRGRSSSRSWRRPLGSRVRSAGREPRRPRRGERRRRRGG